MKRLLMICIVIVCVCTMLTAVVLATPSEPTTNGGGGDSISWYYWSSLTVNETITDLGGGSYRYEYSFVNVDTSPIWHFDVETTFVTSNGTRFTGHGDWGNVDFDYASSRFSEYDARNLDPDILGGTNAYTWPWENAATAIQVNEVTSGFSFTASTYDASPKYYWYETSASGYTQTNGTGKVAAVGTTVPEPAIFSLLAMGGLALLRKRR
jgi:hypothetical protein